MNATSCENLLKGLKHPAARPRLFADTEDATSLRFSSTLPEALS